LHSARIWCEKALFRDAFWRALFGATTTTTRDDDDDDARRREIGTRKGRMAREDAKARATGQQGGRTRD